ncbi:tyrosine-type recombinase/integrase [Synechococcus sp. PROS-U-1]|uniref:tyrosine-type recombinase/integrase n=1 Tax=Synechococcus sp. PROS-U-1 TaxID=1400866 RepID=UPI0021080CAF|nr:tyrosine-type recombinase/integrase [Synechococcus sp. PROS-U-1]
MTRGGWKAPSNTPTTGISEIKTEAPDGLARKSARKPLPPVLDGMDKAEALAYVSRLFDAAEAGAVLWGDALLIKRFISQCSRTGSKATQDGYRFEIREFTRWRDRHHPHLHLREINPAFCQDWVSQLREQVEAGLMKPRTFNRRIAAITSLYRWASEPSRSAVTGVPRNPMPPRSLLHAEKSTRPLTPEQFGLLMAAITRAAHLDPKAQRDYVLIKGAYLLGCRVSEIAVIRWKDIEALDDGGQIRLFGKGSKRRTIRILKATLGLFQGLGRGTDEEFVFPSPRRDGHLTRQAIGDVCRKWGRAAGFHVHPHQLRQSNATHAVQRGVDVFTLQATLGHSSSATTGHYVASNPRDSSSLRLG